MSHSQSELGNVLERFQAFATGYILEEANREYGKNFETYQEFSHWVVKNDIDEALEWDLRRIRKLPGFLAIEEGTILSPKDEEELLDSMEAEVRTSFQDLKNRLESYAPTPDGLSNSEKAEQYERQLKDPFSPLSQGEPGWQAYHVEFVAGLKAVLSARQSRTTGCAIIIFGCLTTIAVAACAASGFGS